MIDWTTFISWFSWGAAAVLAFAALFIGAILSDGRNVKRELRAASASIALALVAVALFALGSSV